MATIKKRKKRPTLFLFTREGKDLNRKNRFVEYLNMMEMTEGQRNYYETTLNGYIEVPTNPTILDTYATDWTDMVGELNQELLEILKDAIKYADFTPRQRQVLDLFLQEKNCGDIAKELGISQTNVTKTLYGCDYKKKTEKKWRYNQGGILNKIKKYVLARLKNDA